MTFVRLYRYDQLSTIDDLPLLMLINMKFFDPISCNNWRELGVQNARNRRPRTLPKDMSKTAQKLNENESASEACAKSLAKRIQTPLGLSSLLIGVWTSIVKSFYVCVKCFELFEWKLVEEVVIHHGGKFVNDGCLKYEGESDTMLFDPDVWSYFVVVSVVKGFGYDGFKELWFSVGCGHILDDRLEPLSDDVGAMHMVNLAQLNGQVHLYVVHTVSEAEVIHMIEYNVDEGGDEVAPQVNEYGEGAQIVEGMDDGLRQQVEVVVGEDHMTKAFENAGERTEAQEGQVDGDNIDVEGGHVERIEDLEVQVEEVEVEEADAEEVVVEEASEVQVEEVVVEEVVVEEAAKVQVKDVVAEEVVVEGEGEGNRLDGEGDRLDGEAYTIEVEDLEVKDLEDSDDGLVDINVQCDVPDNDTEMEVEVEPFLPGSESDSEEDEVDDSSWFNDEWEFEDLTSPDISDEESEDEEGYGHFSTFTMPKKMVDFNWEVGTYFADKHDILDANKSYGVENGKNLKIVKNDRKRRMFDRRMSVGGIFWFHGCSEVMAIGDYG
ncbi:hypothetical protein V8G54_002333 [Vigna mungo]|uniref:PB1-like domain-containing protein n=1 Tax=Vigna mungo TaxID=3915 RepID=A0AAQ3P9H3_VIGMU